MGMSASQARLLSLTARMHDIEFRAQAIQNAKIALGTQSDQVYNEYLEALDATQMTVKAFDPKSGETATIPATFNNLCSIDRVYASDGSKYAIRDNKGRLLVSDEVYNYYQKFFPCSDGNAFAESILGPEPDEEESELDKAKYEKKYDYYVDIYNQIVAAGGECVPISKYDGFDENADAASDSEWLHRMIKSGVLTIENLVYDKDLKGYKLNGTSTSSDTSLAETLITETDKKALTKAEAKYEHDLKEINQKDKKFDMDLNKLEAERTALKTEYDSLKKVIQENVERTFGIFS